LLWQRRRPNLPEWKEQLESLVSINLEVSGKRWTCERAVLSYIKDNKIGLQ
jgi:hypothetical protein